MQAKSKLLTSYEKRTTNVVDDDGKVSRLFSARSTSKKDWLFLLCLYSTAQLSHTLRGDECLQHLLTSDLVLHHHEVKGMSQGEMISGPLVFACRDIRLTTHQVCFW